MGGTQQATCSVNSFTGTNHALSLSSAAFWVRDTDLRSCFSSPYSGAPYSDLKKGVSKVTMGTQLANVPGQ